MIRKYHNHKLQTTPSLLVERAKLQFQTLHLRNELKLLPYKLNK